MDVILGSTFTCWRHLGDVPDHRHQWGHFGTRLAQKPRSITKMTRQKRVGQETWLAENKEVNANLIGGTTRQPLTPSRHAWGGHNRP